MIPDDVLVFLNTYFDKIYVLTLPRATSRHTEIKKHLGNLRYEFFYGVDKRCLSYEQLEKDKQYSEKRARKMHLSSRDAVGRAKIYRGTNARCPLTPTRCLCTW